MTQKKVSIRDLSEATGISIPNIRIWELRYGVFKPKRTSTNIRIYSQDDLSRIILINYLLQSGYRIGKIHNYEITKLRQIVKKELLDNSINVFEKNKLLSLLIEGEFSLLNDFVKVCLEDIASAEFIFNALVPVIKMLPLISSLNENNECCCDYVRNILMQRILVSVEVLKHAYIENMEILILQSDNNELPINMCIANFLAVLKKYKTYLFLNNVSTDSLISLKMKMSPDVIYTEFNEKQEISEISYRLRVIQETFPLSKIIVSGKRIDKVWKTISNRIYITRSFEILYKSL